LQLGVIPARYGSTRFPGKPMVMIAGKPMIQVRPTPIAHACVAFVPRSTATDAPRGTAHTACSARTNRPRKPRSSTVSVRSASRAHLPHLRGRARDRASGRRGALSTAWANGSISATLREGGGCRACMFHHRWCASEDVDCVSRVLAAVCPSHAAPGSMRVATHPHLVLGGEAGGAHAPQ
jgi:hypothetical protein